MQLFNHDLLKTKGKTAYALAKEVHINDVNMYNLVNGKHVPRLPLARAIAHALDMSIEDLHFVGELTRNV